MKIKAILFMYNDFKRAEFVLSNFCKHNPECPVKIINSGGESPNKYLQHISNKIEFVDAPNLWHKKTHCGRGSFGPNFIKYLCEYGLHGDFSHTLYLETDVLTNRKIEIEPKYDISGLLSGCGPKEHVLYEYLNIPGDRYHTGCGGTCFSNNFCYKTLNDKKIYNMYYDLFETHPQNYYLDLIITLVSKLNNLSVGYWEEVSNSWPIFNGKKIIPANKKATLVHGVKV